MVRIHILSLDGGSTIRINKVCRWSCRTLGGQQLYYRLSSSKAVRETLYTLETYLETLTEVEKARSRTVVLLEQVGRRRVARVARHQQPMRRGGRVVLRAEGQGERGCVAGGGALRLHEARVAGALPRRSPRATRRALVRSHLRRRLARLQPRTLLPRATYEEAERTRAPSAAQAAVAVGAAAAPARLVGVRAEGGGSPCEL